MKRGSREFSHSFGYVLVNVAVAEFDAESVITTGSVPALFFRVTVNRALLNEPLESVDVVPLRA